MCCDVDKCVVMCVPIQFHHYVISPVSCIILFAALNRPDVKDTDIESVKDILVDSLFAMLATAGTVCTYACMYACLYVCTYACMYACMYARMYVCMFVRMYVCMYVCMHACMYVCTYA